MSRLTKILQAQPHFEPVVRNTFPYRRLDFSAHNKVLLDRDLSETAVFSSYVFDELLDKGQFVGIGGYDEDRVIYRHRAHFMDSEPRSIHLGTDIWARAGTPVYAPLNGTVHSFAFNNHFGDYGPTIILQHELQGATFYTLYGHLSLSSLEALTEGKVFTAGSQIGTIGPYPENGDWPPHLHFQMIGDMLDKKGDFPGVSSVTEREKYMALCPDPNLLLRIEENR